MTLTPAAPVSGPVGDVPTSPAPTFTVPPGASIGDHTVVVSDAIGGVGHTASAIFTVTSPIVFVGVGPTTDYNKNNQTETVGYPSGTAAGDLLLVICSNSHEEAPPTPTGSFGTWTSLAVETTTVGGHGSLQIFWKFAQAGETSVSVTSPSNEQGFNVCVVAYRHVDATTPFDGVAPATSASATAGQSSFAPTGVSTGSSNAMAVSVVGQNAGSVPTLSLLLAQSFVFEFTNGGNAAGSNSNAAGLADLAVASRECGALPDVDVGHHRGQVRIPRHQLFSSTRVTWHPRPSHRGTKAVVFPESAPRPTGRRWRLPMSPSAVRLRRSSRLFRRPFPDACPSPRPNRRSR